MAQKRNNTNKTDDNKTRLSESEVEQVLKFANYFEEFSDSFNSYSGSIPALLGLNNRYYTPNQVNRSLQDTNMNPAVPTSISDITEALSNPKSSEQILRDYAAYFELTNHYYKRLVNYNADLLAFNLTFDCPQVSSLEEFNSPEYKEDLATLNYLLGKINLKRDGRKIVKQMIRQGVYYGAFRDDCNYWGWQELPANMCQITGDSVLGKLYSFDFTYFLNRAGANIDLYPKVFKKLYIKMLEQMGEMYNPSGNALKRHSSYCYWMDLSPKDNFFCFVPDDGITTLVPYYSSLFPDLYLQPIMRKLETDKAMIAAQKLLLGILDTYETAKAGNVPNQMKINPTTMGKFLALARQALDKSIGITTLPVKEAQVVDFNVEAQNRYTSYQRNIAANSISSSASMLTENKLNALETKVALDIDENFAKSLYAPFEKFLSFYINSHLKKYHFNFTLHDANDKIDKEDRMNSFRTMAVMGLVDINLYARANDYANIFEATRALQMTKSLGVDNYLTSLQSLNNQSKGFLEGGRPTVSNPDSDDTMGVQEMGIE